MTDVLAVGAHPDDLELTLGGTAIKLVERGHEVHFVDVTDHYERKMAAVAVYESVFGVDPDELIEKHGAEDRYTGSLMDVRFAEPFRARRRLLVEDPTFFEAVRYG